MAAATTSFPSCSARTTRATGRCSALGKCRRTSCKRHAGRSPTVPSARLTCSRRPARAERTGDLTMVYDDRFIRDVNADAEDELLLGTRSAIITGPVSDWATDFSHLEPEWSADPYPIQDHLRQRCPIAHTDRFGGGWLPTRYEDVAAIAYDSDKFSSRSIIMGNFRPPVDIAPVGGSPPISSDPPFHRHARRLLLPAFTKNAVSKYEPATRAFCHSLIHAFEGQDVVDAARDYAQHIPVRVIAAMLGFPPEDGLQFREFVENTLEGSNLPPEERIPRTSLPFAHLLDH